MVCRHWLRFEDVDACSSGPPLLQGLRKSRFVHDPATRGVDEDGVGLHQGEFVAPDQVAGVRGQGQMKGNHVGLAQNAVEGCGREPEFLLPFGRQAHVRVGVEAVRPKTSEALGCCLADAAHSNIPDRFACKFHGNRSQAIGVPATGPKFRIREGHAPCRGKRQHDRMFRDPDGSGRADRETDAALGQCRHVHGIVVADALVLDEAQARSRLDGSARQARCRGDDRFAFADLGDALLVVVPVQEDELQGRRLQTLHEVVDLRRAEAVVEDLDDGRCHSLSAPVAYETSVSAC